ncbi:MAG: succinate-semialdehyde dehydrogenase (NADP(+)) [Austwickia sp.]|jgi:succinate-semialdehyde dehydrogenase / glutarate-semialdehyde dehydrogenase|nr:succinate-semialdehyde dehydrogenase (NADP(+)) [Austwickia sp.]MBK8435400.1 succinate-semialdehyde dehydrogenase (NADP(+)) [Austwickia sp.]MBK9101053.1 succinate-semialdehyde dehydrogenase (NADP(+)) [Austwickia sp.]
MSTDAAIESLQEPGAPQDVPLAWVYARKVANLVLPRSGDRTPGVSKALIADLLPLAVSSPGAEKLQTFSPFTGELLAEVPMATVEDVEHAMAAARRAQKEWRERSISDRSKIIMKLHDLALTQQEEILDLIQVEGGKARGHAFEEVADVAITARHFARRANDYLNVTHHNGLLPMLFKTEEHLQPKGVIGIISPWNYPLTLVVTDALAALMAGNAVILKPDSETPLIALWGARLFKQAGLPDGLFQIVVGPGRSIGTALIERADYICFTGSTATGRKIAEQCGSRLIGCSLELGGKNGMYVADDVHVDVAAEGAVRACFANAGQLCVSIERIVLHEKIADEFIDLLTKRVRSLTIGSALDYSTNIGCLINQSQLDTISHHVDDAVAHGAKVLVGGKARPDLGPYFYEPTLLEGVTPDCICYAEETFGPVVAIYRVSSDEEAIDFINNTDYGLNASVWTSDDDRGRAIGRRIQAGTVNINEGYVAAWASVGSPMGGMKDSGLARRHGKDGIRKYCEPQTIATHLFAHSKMGLGMLYELPDGVWTNVMSKTLRALKVAGLK